MMERAFDEVARALAADELPTVEDSTGLQPRFFWRPKPRVRYLSSVRIPP